MEDKIYKYCLYVLNNNLYTQYKDVKNKVYETEYISYIADRAYDEKKYKFMIRFDSNINLKDSSISCCSYGVRYNFYNNTLTGGILMRSMNNNNIGFIRTIFRNFCVEIRNIIFSNDICLNDCINNINISTKKGRELFDWFSIINLLVYKYNGFSIFDNAIKLPSERISLLDYRYTLSFKNLDMDKWIYKRFFKDSHYKAKVIRLLKEYLNSYDVDYVLENNVGKHYIHRTFLYCDIHINCTCNK